MPAATMAPPVKRVLAETTSTRRNIADSPQSAKKRKLNGLSNGAPAKSSPITSSQPKSQFEEQLEQLSQNISDLKHENSEKDQKWERPSLDGFDPKSQELCFQQIDAEEGTISGGNTTVKLFGVTEVILSRSET